MKTRRILAALVLGLWTGAVPVAAQSWVDCFRRAAQAEKEQRYGEAAELYSRVVEITPDETALLDCLNSRAGCYKRLADYSRALADYGRALELAKEPEVRARILFNRTGLLLQTGRYAETVRTLDSLHFDRPAEEVKRRANLAVAYARLGDSGRALKLLDELLERTEGAPEGSSRALLLQNRAFVRWERRDTEGAYRDFCEALPALEGAEHYIALANVAVVEAALKRYDEARKHMAEVEAWQRSRPDIGTRHPDYIVTLRKQGEIALSGGDRAAAERHFRTFYAAELDYVKRNFVTMTEQNRLDFWKKEKPLLSEVFSLGGQCPDFLYDVALLRRHMALADREATATREALDRACSVDGRQVRGALRTGEAAVELVSYRDWLSGDSLYAALLATARGTEWVPMGTKKDLHGYRVAGVPLAEAVCRGARYAGAVYTDTVLARRIWQPLCDALPAGTSVLYFAPDGLFQLLGIENLPYGPLAAMEVHRLSSTAGIVHRGGKRTAGGGGTLVVGGLAYNEAEPPAAEGVEPNRTAYDYAVELCGQPLRFGYLPGAVAEADSVAALLATDRVAEAGEDSLKHRMGRYRTVHLATHGYSLQVALDEPPYFLRDSLTEDRSLLASGIALSGANVCGGRGCAEDGLLSARELCDLDLTGTEFVVLSACQTAQGVVADEGPAGLVRGFKRAGVKSLMASLWTVDDRATALLMKAFYRNWLVKKLDRPEAFRRAVDELRNYRVTQRTVRSRRNLRRVQVDCPEEPVYPYRSPYYWAAFILIDG